MRSQEEIEKAIESLTSKPECLEWKGNTFRYGYLIGKITALEWAMGNAPGSDVGSDFDFEDWQRELKDATE